MGPIYNHGSPWGDQYRQSVGYPFPTTQVPGRSVGLVSQSNYCAIWNWSNKWWWRRDGQIIFRIIFACVRTWYHSFRVNLVSDLHIKNTKWSLNVCISCSELFYKIRLGGTNWHMKLIPVLLIFSSACDSLSNMWNFDCNPCLIRKLANVMNYYTIYAPTPVIHWLWWYIDTFKIVENKYSPIEFVRKDREYPAQIFVNISHRCWDR